LAEELGRLRPFGHGNPEPVLLVPGARLANVRGMGEEAQHARCTLQGSGARAEAVAFRRTPAALGRAGAEASDAAVRLEINEWNGRVEARVVLEAICAVAEGRCAPLGDDGFWEDLEHELGADLDAGRSVPGTAAPSRAIRDRRGGGIAALAGELLSSGEPVLLVCADVPRRRGGLERLLAGLARPPIGPASDPHAAVDLPDAGLPVIAWPALAADPSLGAGFRHLVAVDPPSFAADMAVAARSAGFLYLAWGPAEVDFALAVARASLDLRAPLAHAYRALRKAGLASGDDLRALLAGDGPYPRSGAVCGRILRVLCDLGLARYENRACRAVSGDRTSLERSSANRAYLRRLAECDRYLAAEAARWPPRAQATVGGETAASLS
jgi:single-stranded-DNA-specific exonuclease